MAIVRDLKTGEFMEIPDKEARKFVIPADKVRESLQAAGIGEGGPAGGPGPETMAAGPLPNLVLNLNLNELLARGGGQMPMPQMMPQMPMPQMPMQPMPVGAGHGGPRVAPQWWGPYGHWHPNYVHPYWHPGVWVHI